MATGTCPQADTGCWGRPARSVDRPPQPIGDRRRGRCRANRQSALLQDVDQRRHLEPGALPDGEKHVVSVDDVCGYDEPSANGPHLTGA